MAKTIRINGLSEENIKNAITEVREYARWVERKENELRVKLAARGAVVASIQFSRAIYNGTNDVSVRVDDTGSVAVIYAEGESVAFIEFGSGDRYGHGHPQAGEFGFGPGTWSTGEEGKGHWNDPKGWWYARGKHSYGNPPAMAMYQAVQVMTEELTNIAREVFGTA
jgi:hypothetical protein